MSIESFIEHLIVKCGYCNTKLNKKEIMNTIIYLLNTSVSECSTCWTAIKKEQEKKNVNE